MAVNFDSSKLEEFSEKALKIATSLQHEIITIEHLLAAVVRDDNARKLISTVGGNGSQIVVDVMKHLSELPKDLRKNEEPEPTELMRDIFAKSVTVAIGNGRTVAEASDVIFSILSHCNDDDYARYFLMKNGVILEDVTKTLDLTVPTPSEEDEGGKPSSEQAASFLKKYCTLLNETAKEGKIDPLIGREDEVADIVHVLARRSKNNALIVGPPGVGKSAIAEGLALKIENGEVPHTLLNAQVWSLDIGLLMAGTSYRGEMESRVVKLIEAISTLDNPVLFIDEIHTIVGAGAGSNSGMDMSNLLKPALARGKLRCIGATTQEEARKFITKDKALKRRFQEIVVDEPNLEDTKKILNGIAPHYEEYHGVKFTEGTIDYAVDLADRYISGKHFPDKAIDVIDMTAARKKVQKNFPEEVLIIYREDIEREVAKIAKMPRISIQKSDVDKLKTLEENLNKNVFDQEEACSLLADTVIMNRAGLRENNKPQGVYLLVGTTGSGKTEISKQLASELDIPLVRFDMSEYSENHTVSKLIGAPPGYVGFGDGDSGDGLLTTAIENTPHCVLLLDEIEKANPRVFDMFLQVFDDGHLTSSSGKKVDFTKTIIIMTSNAGAKLAGRGSMGMLDTGSTVDIDKALKKTFSPEFLNRIDATVKFNTLKQETMAKIVDKFIKKLNVLSNERNVTIELSQDAREWLAKEGYDKLLGARPLSRVIDNNIKKPLSKKMLFGELKDGGKVIVSVKDNKIVID